MIQLDDCYRPCKSSTRIRAIFDPESFDPYAVSEAIIEKVRELGLEPFIAPEPLPVIDEDEIMLICWMAVDSTTSP